MTYGDKIDPAGEFRHLTADMIQYLAKQRGIDFSRQGTAKLGFLTALIASMAHADELPPRARSLHASSMFELARAALLEGDAAYTTGWNLGIDVQLLVMESHAKAGALDPASVDAVKDSSAQLRLEPQASESG